MWVLLRALTANHGWWCVIREWRDPPEDFSNWPQSDARGRLMYIWGIIDMFIYNCVLHLEEILFEVSDVDLSTLFPYRIYSSQIITSTIIIIITLIFSNN